MAKKKQIVSLGLSLQGKNIWTVHAKLMRDIADKKDIELLVENFYKQALNDEKIGPLFKKAEFVLEIHIPTMVSFWETILFDVITYRGNPMLKHIELNKTVPLMSAHFEQWMNIWKKTVRMNFEGPLAEKAILRAGSIAQLMQYKIQQMN
ncbi:MAG TPA: group III truncated hemoglobin [Pedobacter sp.]|uniref:group III truncated hemoglobin n=1 Tax=Pedobacter sp. TaxID=1411316 RepID=UPI002BE45CD5|nr:group III truncated hemoglobin [Pedobacter sp.]HMI01978.1 group III truncated hemoglobin [Pedobacter sp.]